jgi:hypothetical protein
VLREEAAAPEQEGVHRVADRDPQQHERDPRPEAHPSQHAAERQNRRDRGKHELEVDERCLREMEAAWFADQRYVRYSLLTVRPQDAAWDPDEVPEETAVRPEDVSRVAEAHVESPQRPRHKHQAERHERQHHAVDGPALLHHAAVEHDQSRDAHQTDERCGGHLPGVVARVQPGWVRR